MTDQTATLADLRKLMTDFIAERQWQKYHKPKNIAAGVTVEAGELLELFQWLTPEEAETRCRSDAAFRKAVGEEMADVLMYVVSLAVAIDLDLASTIEAKMQKNRLKYPADKYQGEYQRPIKSE
jgi:dCTP diphosphatase